MGNEEARQRSRVCLRVEFHNSLSCDPTILGFVGSHLIWSGRAATCAVLQ